MYYKSSKAKPHLVKSYLILFLKMDLFDTLTWAEILVKTTFLGTPTLTIPTLEFLTFKFFDTFCYLLQFVLLFVNFCLFLTIF
jgi:hypothetical protein